MPLVALPSRSGKNAVLGLGYALPCEIQGKFASQYKPSFDKCGLDERRIEAKGLLDEYDRSIKALGKRQPKYTEYPRQYNFVLVPSVPSLFRLFSVFSAADTVLLFSRLQGATQGR